MRKFIIILSMFFCVLHSYAQDIITKTNGEEITAIVVEVGVTEIKYKQFDNQLGPNYAVLKSDIIMIKYKNGKKEIFNQTLANQPKETEQNVFFADGSYNLTGEWQDNIELNGKKNMYGYKIIMTDNGYEVSYIGVDVKFRLINTGFNCYSSNSNGYRFKVIDQNTIAIKNIDSKTISFPNWTRVPNSSIRYVFNATPSYYEAQKVQQNQQSQQAQQPKKNKTINTLYAAFVLICGLIILGVI